MKIDYESITQKADARHNALERLERLISETPAILEHIKRVRDWLDAFANVRVLLDHEGRQLLPPELNLFDVELHVRSINALINKSETHAKCDTGLERFAQLAGETE